MNDSQTQEHMLVETGRCDGAGRRARNRDRVRRADQKGRQLTQSDERHTGTRGQRDRWTCRQLDWMESFGVR